jgi:hypothetical protein
MGSLRVLLTNNTLAGRAGSELYVRDVALALKERGHHPVAYSTILGEVAQDIREAGIEVVDDLAALSCVPDVIHCHHHLETITALLHFPQTPAIGYCHGVERWEEIPVKFPRLLRYIAVSNTCRNQLLDNGISPDRIQVLLNFVDLKRFRPRPPLPPRPTKALVFSNYACETNYLGIVRKACHRAGLDFTALGAKVGRSHPHPEEILPQYDLVFAIGRSAIEALAVGAAVITCGVAGLGNLVTTTNFHSYRELNFGLRTLKRPISLKAILTEIKHYDHDDAQEVSRRIRLTANREDTIDQLLMIYREVIQEYSPLTLEWSAEEKAAAAYLRWLSPWIKNLGYSHDQINRLEDERQNLHNHLTLSEGEKKSLFNSWSLRITSSLRQIKDLLNQFPR